MQQRSWAGAQGGYEQVLPELPFAFAPGRVGDHLHDSGAGRSVRLDVLSSSFCPQRPVGAMTVTFFVIRCHKRDVRLSLKLSAA